MPTAPSAFPVFGAPQAPGDKPNLPEGSKSLGEAPPEAEGNLQVPRHTRPDPYQTDQDWNLLVLELLPYMVDGLAEKVGDAEQFVYLLMNKASFYSDFTFIVLSDLQNQHSKFTLFIGNQILASYDTGKYTIINHQIVKGSLL